jgi:hypothetical protein
VEGILNKIKGQPAAIDCTPEGMCTFDIQDFFVTLVAPCQTASCVVPGYSFVQGALAWLAGWGGMGWDRARAGQSSPCWVRGHWGAASANLSKYMWLVV